MKIKQPKNPHISQLQNWMWVLTACTIGRSLFCSTFSMVPFVHLIFNHHWNHLIRKWKDLNKFWIITNNVYYCRLEGCRKAFSQTKIFCLWEIDLIECRFRPPFHIHCARKRSMSEASIKSCLRISPEDWCLFGVYSFSLNVQRLRVTNWMRKEKHKCNWIAR